MSIILKDDLGYFDDSKKEYIIENMYPKRPLRNYLWSEDVVLYADQFGFGDSLAGINGYRRSMDGGERLIFVKNKKTGEIYSPNRNYTELPFERHECHVGVGYHQVISSYQGLQSAFSIVVPNSGYAVQYDMAFENHTAETQELTVYFLTVPFTALTIHGAYGYADKDEKYGGLYYPHVAYDAPTEYGHLYFAAERAFDSFAVTMDDFTGRYGSLLNPKGVRSDKLCSQGSCFLSRYVAAVSYDVTLSAGASVRYSFAVGIGRSLDEAAQTACRFASSVEFDKTVQTQKSFASKAFDRYKVELPQDEYLQTLINTWLKRQVSLGKSWGRVYGKGFRDRMQDVTAFTAFDPEAAKEKILETLAHQRQNGNPIRQFEPNMWEEYNDGAVWIPDAVTAYIKESGDFSILEEEAPYLEGSKDTVFGHIVKGLEYLTSDVGERGLTLFRVGDWNDSTNGAGLLGKGESVWTSLATVRALKIFAELCQRLGKRALAAEMLQKADTMATAIEKYGLVNGHFIHGYDDWGNIVGGGEEDKDSSFCINMQTWAVLANIGDKAFQINLLDQVEEKTSCTFGYKLANTAYKSPVKEVGRTSYFQPGCFENASVYVHSNMFKAVADCMLGRGDIAYQTVCKVTYRHNPNSGVEPYAVTNMFLGPESKYRVGDAPMSWITGSAGWMYRVLTEFIIGVRADYQGLLIAPVVPKDWRSFSVKREFRGGVYTLHFVRKGIFAIYEGEQKLAGNHLPLLKEGERRTFTIEF